MKIKGTNCMISHALVKRNMTTQNIRQQTYFWQNQYLFFQHSSLTYATMKDNQNICSIKICWKHDKRKIHLHVQQHRQNTKNPEVWGKKCTKVLTDYWKNWAIYVQCKYGANTLKSKILLKSTFKKYTFLLQSQWDYMNVWRIRQRYIHLLYWDIQATLFMSKLTKDMLRD